MLATLVLVGLALAVAARRVAWIRHRLPPPASTLLAAAGATLAGVLLAGEPDGARRILLTGITTAVAGSAFIAAGALVVQWAVRPLQRRRAARPPSPSLRERITARADASPLRIAGWNLPALVVRSLHRAGQVRVTGLGAEMSYYGLISLVPIITALGSGLGFLRPILGEDQVAEIRTSIVDALTTVFAQQVAADVLAPLVDGLLDEERAGFAVGALVVTLYLASRMFRAAVRALEDAYRVQTRRSIVAQFALGLLFTLGALVTLVTVALLVVVGPLVGGGRSLAEALGFGDAFHTVWDLVRWPVAFAVGLTFLTLLYRYAPNVATTWRRCLPGAVLGSLGLLAVSWAFLTYVRLAAPGTVVDEAGDAAVVQAAAQMLSLVLAAVLWLWLGGIVILLGGILNAEMDAERADLASEPTGAQVDGPQPAVGR